MLHFPWQVLSLEFEDDEELLLLDETVSQCYVLRVVGDLMCSSTFLILWGNLSRINLYVCLLSPRALRLLHACVL